MKPIGAWAKFVAWSYKWLGNTAYGEKPDICNCGVDFSSPIPRPELVSRPYIETGSREWRMQFYGAAMYWHLAIHPTARETDVDLDMLRGKDVLEVACMRGGGAAYLMEVCGPKTYVATDLLEDHIEICRRLHKPREGLRYEVAEATALEQTFDAGAFDVVICIQAASKFADLGAFLEGAAHVLRPGGKLIICDAFSRERLQRTLKQVDELGFQVRCHRDLSRAVHAVGLCTVFRGIQYFHIVLEKLDATQFHSSVP